MEKKFLNIEELSLYLGLKKSNLYSKVERREIPFYKWGRLIMFNKDEIDAFVDRCRIEIVDLGKEAKRIQKRKARPGMDMNIDGIVKKAVDEVKRNKYNLPHGKPDHKGLGEEVENGSL
jgi:excisionase family DNA binding protein